MAEEQKKRTTKRTTSTTKKDSTSTKPKRKTTKKNVVNYEYEETNELDVIKADKGFEDTIDNLIKMDIEDEEKDEAEDTIEAQPIDDFTMSDIDKMLHKYEEKEKKEEPIELDNTQDDIAISTAVVDYKRRLNTPKKKQYRLNKKGIVAIVLIIVLVDFLFISLVVNLSKNKKVNDKNDSEIKETKHKKEEKKKEETKKEEKKEEKKSDRNKYDLNKLKQLNDIDTQISFFKYDNIDRYLAYKTAHPDFSDEMIVVYVNIGLDKAFYSEIKASPNVDTNKVLVNKYNNLSSDYEPSNLVTIDNNYSSGNRQMVKEAAEAFAKLAQAAKNEGFTVRAVSTYRSYVYQRDLYNRYAANDGADKADTYSARPGHSEHQTGLAVDVDNANASYTSFGGTREFEWMKANAYKYGFILRFTEANEWITGYNNEPWHYRYVGEEIAKFIQEHPMTFEEYFVRFLDK